MWDDGIGIAAPFCTIGWGWVYGSCPIGLASSTVHWMYVVGKPRGTIVSCIVTREVGHGPDYREQTSVSHENSSARVLIVDDHPAVREGIIFRISRQPDLAVCGEAANVAEALRLVETTEPDVVVIDISLADGNGIDLIKRIRSRDARFAMLVCSMHPDSLYAERALRAGALGYINKDNTTGRILDAIRSVRDGEIYLSGDATRRAGTRTIRHAGHPGLSLEALSDRELEIFKLIGEGQEQTRSPFNCI